MKRERIGLLLTNALLTLAGLLLSQCLWAQSMPGYLSRDPEYWWRQYQTERTRADGLERAGSTAINGLTGSLAAANDSITVLNRKLTRQQERAETAEAKADTLQNRVVELEGKQPKTWAGKQLRRLGNGTRNVLAGIGAVAVAVTTIKIILR